VDSIKAQRIMLLKANNCMRNHIDFESLLSILKSGDTEPPNILYGNQAMTEVPGYIVHLALSPFMSDEEIMAAYELFRDGDRNIELEDMLGGNDMSY